MMLEDRTRGPATKIAAEILCRWLLLFWGFLKSLTKEESERRGMNKNEERFLWALAKVIFYFKQIFWSDFAKAIYVALLLLAFVYGVSRNFMLP
ncbi:MAG: hypothetical protein HYV90_05020 [Candidatus Woesebacteria bacterium]|nr:MAG: hypothetical protein HYV90_05020 [Candidatus Woesebacteria bacterium]